MMGNAQDGLDATQWVYLRAFEVGIDTSVRPRALAWLYKTATYRCMWVLRNRSSRSRIRATHHATLAGPPVPSPEHAALDRDLAQRALARVDERTAEIALLTWVQGMSHERVAELYGISVRTVGRARQRFEEVLRDLADEEHP